MTNSDESPSLPTALVTNAGSSVGRGIAIRLAGSKKYKLCLLSNIASSLSDVCDDCRSTNSDLSIFSLGCDVGDAEELLQFQGFYHHFPFFFFFFASKS